MSVTAVTVEKYFLHPGLKLLDIPGCGKGYRAAFTIPKGTLVCDESPLFIVQPGQDTVQGINQKVSLLLNTRPAQHQEFQALTISHQFLSDPAALNRGRFLTNALPCGLRAGIFLHGARFNSSCRPNVHYDWSDERNTMQFRVMRKIEPWEELCIAYNVSGLLQPRRQRQDNIRRTSGFYCSCPACVSPLKWDQVGADKQTFSDNTRSWLQGVILPAPGGPHQNIQTISDALKALHQDGILLYRDTLFYDGFTVCSTADDTKNAMLWLRRAYDAAVAVVGETDHQVINIRNLLMTRTAASFGSTSRLIPPPELPE